MEPRRGKGDRDAVCGRGSHFFSKHAYLSPLPLHYRRYRVFMRAERHSIPGRGVRPFDPFVNKILYVVIHAIEIYNKMVQG